MTQTDDDDDDGLLSPERLARYEVPGAPAGFAARVAQTVAAAAARDAQAPPPARAAWRRRAIAGGLLAAAAAVIALMAVRRSPGGRVVSGARTTGARATITIAHRAVVVAEPGTALHWTVRPDGDAVVEQTAGSAFYRVEPGGAFVVDTPLGVVTDTGTCFSVEVEPMKNPMKTDVMKGAAIGAALASAVLVTVYEGSVSLANPRGQLPVAAGQAAIVQAGAAPRPQPPGTLVHELTDANARIASLEAELASARSASAAAAPPAPVPFRPFDDPSRFIAPSQETLLDMAKKCELASDLPPLVAVGAPVLVDARLGDAVGLGDAERDAINQAYRALNDRTLAKLRALYMELTGASADAAAALSVAALGDEILQKSRPDDELAARRRIARERAGLDPEPTADELARRPVIERYLRLKTSLGNEAETAAAAVVGADTARELRSHDGGWEGRTFNVEGCHANQTAN